MFQPSPMETLASYAVAFAAGALAVVIVSAYGKWVSWPGGSSPLN